MRQLLQKATERPHLQFATTAPPLGQEVVVVIETQVQLDSFEAKDYRTCKAFFQFSKLKSSDLFELEYFQSLSTASNKRNSTTNSTIVPSVSAADRPFQMRVNTIEELLESRKA